MTDPTGGMLDPILSGLDDAIQGIGNEINDGLQDIEGDIIGNLTSAVGLADRYDIYTRTICSGHLENENDPNSDITMDDCVGFKDAGSGRDPALSEVVSCRDEGV